MVVRDQEVSPSTKKRTCKYKILLRNRGAGERAKVTSSRKDALVFRVTLENALFSRSFRIDSIGWTKLFHFALDNTLFPFLSFFSWTWKANFPDYLQCFFGFQDSHPPFRSSTILIFLHFFFLPSNEFSSSLLQTVLFFTLPIFKDFSNGLWKVKLDLLFVLFVIVIALVSIDKIFKATDFFSNVGKRNFYFTLFLVIISDAKVSRTVSREQYPSHEFHRFLFDFKQRGLGILPKERQSLPLHKLWPSRFRLRRISATHYRCGSPFNYPTHAPASSLVWGTNELDRLN